MSPTNQEIEERIINAIHALSDQSRPNIAAAAREFDVPYQRLKARFKGRKSLFEREPNGRRLNPDHESALSRWIDYNDELGLPLKRPQIIAAATSILKLFDPSAPPPGPKWLKRWLQRHPEYRVRRRKALDIERLRAQDKSLVQEWFTNYENMIQERGILPEDLYNFDETGFRIGVGTDQWIVTREPRRKIVSGSVTNREYATVVEAISTNGFSIPPLIILSGQQLQFRWFNDLDGDNRISVTETGYINDALAYQWIQHFERSTRARTKGVWRMLLCDGFGSHLTYEFTHFCEEKKIQLFFLPPHCSHILQPLDVGVFSVYKHYHSEAVEDATATGCTKFGKVDFLAAISSIRAKTFKLSTIRLGFRLSGIWPINPDLVCDQLVDYDPYKSSPPPSSCSDLSTPKTVTRFERLENKLLALTEDIEEQTESLNRQRDITKKLGKGARACLYELAEARRERAATTAAMSARHARADLSRSYFRSKGIISSSQVARMKRVKQKLGDLEALDKLRPTWKKVMKELKQTCRASGRRLRK
jgi:hypothetical protein